MVHPRRSHRLPVLVLLAGLAGGAACAGPNSGPGDGVASIKAAGDKQTGSEQDDKRDKAETNPEEAMLAFARCMREHGIDMPDPDTSGDGPGVVTFRAGAAGTKIDADTSKFQEAHEACQHLMDDIGPLTLSPEQQQEMQDQALAFSRCMRDHGVDMPDPSFDGEGHVMMRIGPDDGLDPSDPKFEAAQLACGSAFGPAGAKGGVGLSVGGGKADGSGAGKGGAVFFGGGAARPAPGGGK